MSWSRIDLEIQYLEFRLVFEYSAFQLFFIPSNVIDWWQIVVSFLKKMWNIYK